MSSVKEHFDKKLKKTLVADCVYFQGEFITLNQQLREQRQEIAKLQGDTDKARSKNAALQDSIQKLTEVVVILKNRLGI